MLSKIFTPRFLFVTFAIILTAASRLIPHAPNFTSIGAMALFGGALFADKRIALIIPLLAMLISDCILELVSGIGFHNTILYVYASFVLITFIGIYIRSNVRTGTIILASLISSLLFFFITNSAVWIAADFQNGFNGLLTALIAGIPFYKNELFGSFFFNTIAGDLFYCGILFGSYYLAQLKFPALAKA